MWSKAFLNRALLSLRLFFGSKETKKLKKILNIVTKEPSQVCKKKQLKPLTFLCRYCARFKLMHRTSRLICPTCKMVYQLPVQLKLFRVVYSSVCNKSCCVLSHGNLKLQLLLSYPLLSSIYIHSIDVQTSNPLIVLC
jgi:hypothetical protein